MYPVPACELPLSISSTEALNDELLVSIDNTWFLTGTISFEFGIAVKRKRVDAEPSTFDTLLIKTEFILMIPFA